MVSKSRILANLGKAVDSATTGHFLAKGVDSNGIFETILYTDLVGTPTTLDSALTSQLIDSSYVQLRQTTSGGGIDSAAVTTLIDSSYVAARSSSGSSGFVRYEYDTTANATTFQDSDKTGQVLSYTEDYILVHYNGILMADTDYTATNGTSVVFSSGVDSGGIVSVTKFSAPSSGGGASGLAWGGDRCLMASNQGTYQMDYFDMTSTSNAADFGDIASHIYNCGSYSNASRAIWWGGDGYSNSISYNTISTPGNTADFGDLTTGRRQGYGGACDGTRGVMVSGIEGNPNYAPTNVMDYITVANTGNATDFGDATITCERGSTTNDGTYGLHAGAFFSNSGYNNIGRFTIQTAGNASDFGDLTSSRGDHASCSDTTRAVFSGGRTSALVGVNTIDYVTTATPGNATDFGDLVTGQTQAPGSASNGTRGVVCGGSQSTTYNTIQYFVIQTAGNGVDLADLTATMTGMATAGNAS